MPADVILEAQEAQRYGGYIKVTYKNRSGYIFKAEVKRYMDVPAPELVCWSNGYKIIGGVYRYFSFCAMTARSAAVFSSGMLKTRNMRTIK